MIGAGDQVATALFGGLILKEAAKVPAEGFLAGNFRHGPLEIAGPGLTAVVVGLEDGEDGESLRRLAADIADTGASVVTFGTATVPGCEPVTASAYDGFAGLVAGAELCHRICVQVALGRGLVPGQFRFGQKVTGLCSSVNDEDALRVGIDLGGTASRIVALDGVGGVVAERLVDTRSFAVGDALTAAQRLIAQIQTVTDGRPLRGVGIGASGPIDAAGVIRNPDTLPEFTGMNLPVVVAAELTCRA